MKAPLFLIAGLCLGLSETPFSSPDAELAAPRIIMVYGGALTERYYLTDWKENLQFMRAVSEVSGPITDLRDERRPYVELALFWDATKWDSYARDSLKLKTLDPGGRDVGRGRLYYGEGSGPPVLVYSTAKSFRIVKAAGVEILARHGVAIGDSSRAP